jgi:hypothetical protein
MLASASDKLAEQGMERRAADAERIARLCERWPYRAP